MIIQLLDLNLFPTENSEYDFEFIWNLVILLSINLKTVTIKRYEKERNYNYITTHKIIITYIHNSCCYLK